MSKGEIYVFSTLTAPVNYQTFEKSGNDLPMVTGSILINGGSNIPDKNLVTPIGVMTRVTEEQFSLLAANPVFNKHMENGYISIQDKPADPEKVASDMNSRDESAPLRDADFDEKEAANKGLTGVAKPKSSRRA